MITIYFEMGDFIIERVKAIHKKRCVCVGGGAL